MIAARIMSALRTSAGWPLPAEAASGTTDDAVETLAERFRALPLAPGAPIGLRLPGGPEWMLAVMAASTAGLTPCFLPLFADMERLTSLVEELRIEAIVSCAQLGEMPLGHDLAELAAGYFGLRFPMAFGVNLPDGIGPLPSVDPRFGPPSALATMPRVHYLTCPANSEDVVLGDAAGLLAAAAAFVEAASIGPGERILHLGLPDRFDGLVTSLGAACVAKVVVEWHAPFDAERFAQSLRAPAQTHLVVPAGLEPALGKVALLPRQVSSITVLHRPPTVLRAAARFDRTVIDIVALDERALLIGRRDRDGRPAVPLSPTVKVDESGGAETLGQAHPLPVRDVRAPFSSPAPMWRPSDWRLQLFAGRVIEIARSPDRDRMAET